MKLLRARIKGFQSFGDSGDITFSAGINLVVGQNNAGKSALLRALQPSYESDKHRTPSLWQDFRLPNPEVTMLIGLSGSELRDDLLQAGQCHVPIPPGQNVNDWMEYILDKPFLEIEVKSYPDTGFSTLYPSHKLFSWVPGQYQASVLVSSAGGNLSYNIHPGGGDSLNSVLHSRWIRNTFFFNAERMNIGEYGANPEYRLNSNAINLPGILNTINGERRDVFNKIVEHLREVFPTVGNMSVRPIPGSSVEIRIWPTEAMERVELSFPLRQSGTGVSQILAILTAVMTVENSVIMIDEINSFLHPAAVKALLRILQTQYGQHQYIISTHAPEVVGFSNPRTIHLVKRCGYESTITKLDLGQVGAFREVAEQLGVSMADVFAADRVIWVEGPTEELCFPLIYQHAAGETLPRGTIFTSVMATGDFMAKRRDKELIYQIYERLSQVAVPLVVSVAFSFDSEQLSENDKEDMRRASRGAMHFLPRRHIECYLLNPAAIAGFIAERDAANVEYAMEELVEAKLIELASVKRYEVPEWKGDLKDGQWLEKVDAANLIAETCSHISDQRVTFNKKDDTLALLQRVLAGAPEQIEELSGYVRGLVRAVSLPK